MHKVSRRSGSQPAKPRKDFPLFKHARGYWAKKVRGRTHYFGKIADDQKGEAALIQWLDQKDALLAGRTPRVHQDGLLVRDLCNRFLTAKRQLTDSGELSEHTFRDYHETCARICNIFGKTRLVDDLATEDFDGFRAEITKTWGPVAVGNEINRVRVVFKYGYDAGLIDKPVRYGPHFKRPSKRTLRLSRARRGPRMFAADEIRQLLDAATQPMKAMILLGINCGLGNTDCGNLEYRHLDLKGGWLNYPRPKTGINRRAKLWRETIEAINEAVADRPSPKGTVNTDLVFLTKYRGSWSKSTSDSPVSKEMAKLLAALKLARPGVSFYALRHTFETVAGESRDQVAVDHVMGHSRDDMASVYREAISDDRLKAVAEQVRKWLFPGKRKPK